MMSNFLKAFLIVGTTLLISGPLVTADNSVQEFEQLPACAKLCVVTAYQTMNNACGQTDAACFCKSSAFINTSRTCYQNSCSGDDYQKARTWGLKSCAQAGVAVIPDTTDAASKAAPQSSAPDAKDSTKDSAKSSASVLVSSAGPIIASTLMATLFM